MKNIITSLAGGLVEKVRPDLLNDGEVQTCNNMKVDTLGVLVPVNDLSEVSDLGSYDYVWLWRMYRKPYVFNGSNIVESPYNYVYIVYSEATGTLSLIGYYDAIGTKYSTVNFKIGEGAYSTISIPVSQKPSLALTNIRCTIVDGVEGNNARYIEIDDEGNVVNRDITIESSELPVSTTSQTLSQSLNGMSADSGTFFGYRFSVLDGFGVESQYCPMRYNTSVFEANKDQAVYDGFNPSNPLEPVLKKYVVKNNITFSDIPDYAESINIYRSEAKYTQGIIPPTTFKFTNNIDASVTSYSDTDIKDESAEAISLGESTNIKSTDITAIGNLLIATGTNNNISFPLPYTKYMKIVISNKNSRNYINVPIRIISTSFIPSDLGDYSKKGYRFYMDDKITPIPCMTEDVTSPTFYFNLRIPILYGNMDNIIYLAYYPNPLSEVDYDSAYQTHLSGYPYELTRDNIISFASETGEHFINRYNIKDENVLVVLGGRGIDNGASIDSCEIDGTVSLTTLDGSESSGTVEGVHKYANKYDTSDGGIYDFPQNTINISQGGRLKIIDGLLPYDEEIAYSMYGYFLMNTSISEGESFTGTVFKDVANTNTVELKFSYSLGVGSSIQSKQFNVYINGNNASNFTHTLDYSLPGRKHFFIYLGVSKVSQEICLYIKDLETEESFFKIGTPSTIFNTASTSTSRDLYIGSTSDTPNMITKISDFYFHNELYLEEETVTEHLGNTGVIFDIDHIGFDSFNSNIFADDSKTIAATPSSGTIRWSDTSGLTFPTLNELVVGREVIKIVPRLGSKDSYESIVDVYTKSGIYILSIDKLSSTTDLIPLTGESGTFILQNKDSIVTVDSSNYFVSNNTLYRQTGESFTDLSSGKVSIACDKVTYFPEYKAIGLAKTGNASVLMYDTEKNIYFKQTVSGALDFADISEDNKRMIIFDTAVKTLSTSLATTGLTVKSKRFYVGLASLIRFNIEFEGKVSEDNLFTIKTIFEGTVRTRTFSEVAFGTSITLDIESNKWYHFPNGLICEYFELELYNYTGIKKIEIEYRPRGRR